MLPVALLASLMSTALVLASSSTEQNSWPTSRLLTLANEASSSGNYAKAIDLYGVVVEREPEDYLSLYKRSTAYMAAGQSKKAAEDLEQVLRLSKDFDSVSLKCSMGLQVVPQHWHDTKQYITYRPGYNWLECEFGLVNCRPQRSIWNAARQMSKPSRRPSRQHNRLGRLLKRLKATRSGKRVWTRLPQPSRSSASLPTCDNYEPIAHWKQVILTKAQLIFCKC